MFIRSTCLWVFTRIEGMHNGKNMLNGRTYQEFKSVSGQQQNSQGHQRGKCSSKSWQRSMLWSFQMHRYLFFSKRQHDNEGRTTNIHQENEDVKSRQITKVQIYGSWTSWWSWNIFGRINKEVHKRLKTTLKEK